MEGRTCDKCKRSFFNLQSDEPEGCVPCFCFGLTNDCKCANYYKDTVRMLASLSDLQSSPVVSKVGFIYFLYFQIVILSSVFTLTLNSTRWGGKNILALAIITFVNLFVNFNRSYGGA